MNNFQFTFYNVEHKYKPITVTITPRSPNEKFASLKRRATQKVCAERQWTLDEMIYKYCYTKLRFRQVDKDGKPIIKVEREVTE